jgi:methanethiol S-methyltransferase
MSRLLALVYGLVAYLVFFGTILYAIGFVTGLPVPKTIDDGAVVPLTEAVLVNLLLMGLFAVQHSAMARQPFKRWLTRFVSPAIERSTFVLLASLVLLLLFWQWRPIPTPIWQINDLPAGVALTGLSLVGWVIVFASTFMINHFELFGLHQVVNNLAGRDMPAPGFRTPAFYQLVRHPIYLGFIIAFWATPTMTVGHLLFAAVTTAYIFIGIALEERDLVDQFGDQYRRYRRRVAMIVPFLGGSGTGEATDKPLGKPSRSM